MTTDPNQISHEAWDANAEHWDSRMGDDGNDFFNLLCWPVLASFLDPQPDSAILDIACGNGLTSRRLAALGANITAFDAHASCGQGTPCREGSVWLKKITSRMVHGEARTEDGTLLKSVADQIAGRTICAFGEACSWPTQSFIAKFGDEFKAYAETKKAAKANGSLELV